MQLTVFMNYLVFAIGIFIFSKGFLLSREPLKDVSSSKFSSQPNSSYSKVIIIVIDALRYDFVHYNESNIADESYLNNIKTFSNVSDTTRYLLHSKADPPTTTMQRIKAFLTGSLPSFIEAGSNFATKSLEEDNLFSHLSKKFNRVHFFGDDTWVHLFPDLLKDDCCVFPFESFKLFDLHTVDSGIERHMFPVLKSFDFDIIVAHFLGVDHCGHKYGPSHQSMGEKLKQMDNVLSTIIQSIDSNTLLIGFGDHGMNAEGDHGGDSFLETSAAAFFVSKRSLLPESGYIRNFTNFLVATRGKRLSSEGHFKISQIDLTPTLSYLLSIPIPFNNLGVIIPTLLEFGQGDIENLRILLTAYYENALQISNYLEAYFNITKSPEFNTPEILKFKKSIKQFELNNYQNRVELEQACIQLERMIHDTTHYCRKIWADFNIPLIAYGIVVCFLCVVIQVLVQCFTIQISVFRFAFVLAVTFLLSLIYISPSILICLGIAISSSYFVSINFSEIQKFHHPDYKLMILALLSSLRYASNSFIIFEDKIILFILQSLLALHFVFDGKNVKAHFICLLALRAAYYFGVCREEQYPYCSYLNEQSINLDIANFSHWTILYVANIITLLMVITRLKNMKILLAILSALQLIMWDLNLMNISLTKKGEQYSIYNLIDNALNLNSYSICTIWLPRILALSYLAAFTVNVQIRPIVSLLFLTIFQRPVSGHLLLLIFLPTLEKISSIFGSSKYKSFALPVYHFLGEAVFFTSSHQAIFPAIQWEAAFIGFDKVYYYVSMVLVGLNTVIGSISSTSYFMIFAASLSMEDRFKASKLYSMFYTLPILFQMIFNTILRRHLMIWKIFTPRWMLQALNFFTTVSISFVSYLLSQ